MKIKNLYSLFIAFVVIVQFPLFAQTQNLQDTISVLSSEISTYNYGEDRTALFKFNELLIESINSNSNLDLFEDQLIALLESNSTLDAKDFACRELSLLKSEEAIDALFRLFENSDTRNMARFALDKIPVSSVDSRLIGLIKDSDNEVKIAAINSLGFRKTESAIDLLADLTNDSELTIAAVSGKALGNIGGVNSAQKIKLNLSKDNPAEIGAELIDSYLKITEDFYSDGNLSKANEMHSDVYNNYGTPIQKQAALVGLLKTTENDRELFLTSVFTESEPELLEAVFTQFVYLFSSNDLETLVENFNSFIPTVQVKILNKVTELKYKQFLNVARQSSKTTNPELQLAAIRAIGSIGSDDDVELLLSISSLNGNNLKQVCQESINNLKGWQVDEKIVELLKYADEVSSTILIRAIDSRRIKSGFDELTRIAMGGNQKLRLEAYSALSTIAEPSQLNYLTEIFLSIENPKELKRFESTLAKVSLKNPDPNERATEFIAAFESTNEIEKEMSLLRILGATGDPKAFEKIEEYLAKTDDEMKKTAILSLYNWPNLDPLNRLLEIITNTDDNILKVLATRGYLNLLKNHGQTNEQVAVDLYRAVESHVENNSEKIMILSGLAEIKNLESAEFVSTFLKNEELKTEAQISLLSILEFLKRRNPNETLKYLDILKTDPANEEISLRVEKMIKSIDSN